MKASLKENLKPLAMAAGFYGLLYAGLEAQHNYECPRDDVHSNFSESHMSEEMIADAKKRDAEHAQWMLDAEKRKVDNQEVFADIDRITSEITHKLGVIQGILIAREQMGVDIVTGEPK